MSIVSRSDERRSDERRSSNIKYIQLAIIAAVILGFMFFSAPSGGGVMDLDVYSLRGHNDFAVIHSTIIKSDSALGFVSGTLMFLENVDVIAADKEFFYVDENGSHSFYAVRILSNRHPISYLHNIFPRDIGYLRDKLDVIIDTIYCEIVVEFANGTTKEFLLEFNNISQGRALDVLVFGR